MKKIFMAAVVAGAMFCGGASLAAEEVGLFLENFSFTDGSAAISDTAVSKITVSGNVDSKRESNVPAKFIGALYDENEKLVSVSAKDVTVAKNSLTAVSITLDNEKLYAGGKVSCFLWDKETLTVPYARPVTFKKGVIDYNKYRNVYYVAPSGSATADGSAANPFDSISTAQDYINTVKYNIDEDIIVNVAEGEYELSEPIVMEYDDSGVYGHKIIYRGSGEAMLSGGERLTGWTNVSGNLYSISLPDKEYVRELYVNNRMAQRSRTQSLVFGDEYYKENGESVGIVVPYDEKLATIRENDGCDLTSVQDWRHMSLKISKVSVHPSDSSKLVLYFRDGATAASRYEGNASYKLSDGTAAGLGFHVENAMGLLDEPNEFYFDRESKILYYMAEDGKNPDYMNIYVPELEKLLLIKGNHSGEKVTNIGFENLIFQHTRWQRAEDDDYIPFQGAMIYGDDTTNNNIFPQNGLVPAMIQMDMADGIEFKNNTVACSGNNGIGIYGGVEDSDISGNIVTQTAHGGVTVGLAGHAYNDKGYNVAYRKPVTASSFTPKNPPTNLTDGDKDYIWISEDEEKSWCIIDLGAEYNITGVGIHTWGAQTAEDRKNFVIEGSKTANFSFRTTLATVTSELVGGTENSIPLSKTGKFRYIRYTKTGRSAVGDIAVYTNDLGDVLARQGSVNNTVSNNYISNIGKSYADAVGIHAFYTDTLTISNNTIRNVPYSAISLGWGWERTSESTVAKNNRIVNNRIENSMKKARDGAAIYTLGHQPGMEILGNYIKGTRNSFGGIYPDEGTNGKDTTIQITGNVVEGGPMWFHGWENSIGNINVSGNYTTTDRQRNDMDGDTSVMSDNKLYIAEAPPQEVSNIISASGITDSYSGIFDKLVRFSENSGRYEIDSVVKSVGGIKLIDTFELRQPGEASVTEIIEVDDNTADYYINAGNRIAAPGRLTSALRNATKSENLRHVIRMYNYYVELITNNPSWLNGHDSEYQKLVSVMTQVDAVNNSNTVSQWDIYNARIMGEKALDEFASCGVFAGRDTIRTLGSASDY